MSRALDSNSVGAMSQARRPEWLTALQMVAIVLLTIVAYLPALQSGFVWNDDDHLTRVKLRSWDGLLKIWIEPSETMQYYPLTHSSFWVMQQWWGNHPLGYHAVNIALHAANALLVLVLLRRLKVRGAAFAAMLFAVHPVQVESVAWITELKNTLSGLLVLLATLKCLKFQPLAGSASDAERISSRHWPAYWTALGLFALAMLSKTVVATAPAALLVLTWWRHGRISLRVDVIPLVPWFVMAIGMGLMTTWFEHTTWGASGEQFDLNVAERTIIAGRAVWFYLATLAWPINLVFFYPKWSINSGDISSWLYPIAVMVTLAALLMFRGKLGRAPLAVALLYGGMLFPALGYFNLYWQIYTYVCDHMQYLPCISVFALVAAGASAALDRLGVRQWIAPAVLASLIGAVLAMLTWVHCLNYRDARTLFLSVQERNPGSWMVYENLGEIEYADGDFLKAIDYFNHAIQLNPGYAPTLVNLGLAQLQLGRTAEAESNFLKAIEADSKAADAYEALGLLYANTNRMSEAEHRLRQAVAARHNFASAQVHLGMVLIERGQTDEAMRHFRDALLEEPGIAALIHHNGEALMARNKYREALAHFQILLEMRPSDRRAEDGRRRAQSAIDRR